MLGGTKEASAGQANSLETEELGRFAVEQHNQKANALLEFNRVVEVKEQVVAGTLYHLMIDASDGGIKKQYHAKVWVKPWINFKELQEFNPVGDSSSTA